MGILTLVLYDMSKLIDGSLFFQLFDYLH